MRATLKRNISSRMPVPATQAPHWAAKAIEPSHALIQQLKRDVQARDRAYWIWQQSAEQQQAAGELLAEAQAMLASAIDSLQTAGKPVPPHLEISLQSCRSLASSKAQPTPKAPNGQLSLF